MPVNLQIYIRIHYSKRPLCFPEENFHIRLPVQTAVSQSAENHHRATHDQSPANVKMSTKVSNFSIDSILNLPRSYSDASHFSDNKESLTYCELDSTSEADKSLPSLLIYPSGRESDTASDVGCVTSSTSPPSSDHPEVTLEGMNLISSNVAK